jgi:hypothetical protein
MPDGVGMVTCTGAFRPRARAAKAVSGAAALQAETTDAFPAGPAAAFAFAVPANSSGAASTTATLKGRLPATARSPARRLAARRSAASCSLAPRAAASPARTPSEWRMRWMRFMTIPFDAGCGRSGASVRGLAA